MPLSHFQVMVAAQRENGVRLIEGCDDGCAAKQFINAISTAVKDKVAAILVEKEFVSCLSDGSQARKTGDEMELILTRVERNGLPCYFVTSLALMSQYGGKDLKVTSV